MANNNSEHAKRTWHAGKPKKKPDFDANTVTEELIASVTDLYLAGTSSLHAICEALPDLHLNPMKVRKLLITAGVYEGRERTADMIEAVNQLHEEGYSVPQIADTLHLSKATVHSYLPYTKIVYKLDKVPGGEKSVAADRQELYRMRKRVCENVKDGSVDTLWEAIRAFAGYPFQTAQGLSFTYAMKPNRYGEPGNEIVFSRKEKSVTKATVAKAYERVKELGDGVIPARVDGPKKLGVFGASYLYPVFVRLGVIEK